MITIIISNYILLPGNDTLKDSPGGDYFRCGSGIDSIGAFNPAEGDHEFGDCEIK